MTSLTNFRAYVIDSDASPSSFICCGLGCRSCETQPVRYVQCRSDAVWPFHQYWCGWSIAAGRNQKQHCTAPASASSSCTSQPASHNLHWEWHVSSHAMFRKTFNSIMRWQGSWTDRICSSHFAGVPLSGLSCEGKLILN